MKKQALILLLALSCIGGTAVSCGGDTIVSTPSGDVDNPDDPNAPNDSNDPSNPSNPSNPSKPNDPTNPGTSNEPTSLGTPCTSDDVCTDGLVCHNYVCSRKLPIGGDCAPSHTFCETGTCKNGICVASCSEPDEDGDTISDEYEGRSENIDSYESGTPDYLNSDTDGDTIPDAVEAGTNNCSGNPPEDTNLDGMPDFRSTDSDGNGIPDAYEGCPSAETPYIGKDSIKPTAVCDHPIDTDADTIPDFIDFDNDGDKVNDSEEIRGMTATHEDAQNNTFGGDCDGDGLHDPQGSPESPIDCDGDTIPDYLDTDSDGDTVPDVIEGRTLINGIYARYTKDADGDTVPDNIEVGDDPLHPRDTDGDTIPDFIDLDSDNDGLPDAWENAHEGFDPYNPDTDGDGVSDLVEYGAGTKPNDPNDNPQTRGNFVFVTPYKEPSTPEKQTLSFETAVQTVDLFFVFDHTGSMGEEIKSLRTSLKTIINDLKCKDFGKTCTENNDCTSFGDAICSEQGRCIANPKSGDGCFDNMWTGLGYYSDENTFWVAANLSSNSDTTVTMLDRTFRTNGNFCSTGSVETPYQAPICAILGTKTYNNLTLCKQWGSNTCLSSSCGTLSSCKMNCSTDPNKLGCAGFRKDAIRIYLQAFDEEQCGSSTNCNNYKKYSGPILKENNVRFIGLWSGGNSMKAVAEKIGKDSGTVDATGNPFAYQATDSALAEKAKEGIRAISKNMPIQITTEKSDIDENAAQLVDKLVLNTSGEKIQNRICTNISNTITPVGQLPGIKDLKPGTSVCYDVYPVQSQSVFPATDEPQIKKARIFVKGDGSVLNSGIVYFLIPPKTPSTEIVN